MKVIEAGTASFSDAVRHWRNFIHPAKEMKSSTKFGKNVARAAVLVIFGLTEGL